MYKAVDEAHIDPLWAVIYVLIGIEYAFDVLSNLARKVTGRSVGTTG
jgi:hypothetical protein